MPPSRPAPSTIPDGDDDVPFGEHPDDSRWAELHVRVPRQWLTWLREAAEARGLPVAGVVRQCIRELMITRHDG